MFTPTFRITPAITRALMEIEACRQAFIAMSTKGALDAIGHPATAPITAALPPQPKHGD